MHAVILTVAKENFGNVLTDIALQVKELFKSINVTFTAMELDLLGKLIYV